MWEPVKSVVYARRVSRPRSRLALALVLVLMYGAAVGAKPSQNAAR